MAKKKEGAISSFEQMNIRENAIRTAYKNRAAITGKIPHRINPSTLIFLDPEIDKETQINRYLSRLESDRNKH